MSSQTIVGTAFQPRVQLIDAVRGYALMGLFIVHCLELFELYWAIPQAKTLSHDVVWFLFAGKSFALLGLCFGLSFYILMDRARQRGQDFTLRFVWRLLILFAFGYVHSIMYRGDILQILAPMGLLLIPFDRVKSNVMVMVAAVICMLQPMLWTQIFAGQAGQEWALAMPRYYKDTYMPVYTDGTFAEVLQTNLWDGQWFKWHFMIDSGRLWQLAGLFLTGMVLGRIGFFSQLKAFRAARHIALVGFALLFAIIHHWGGALAEMISPSAQGRVPNLLAHSIVGGWKDLSIMFMALLIFVSLYDWFNGAVLKWLAPVGRMTLTLYVGQSLIFVPVYYGFGLALFRTITQDQALILGIVTFTVQVILAHFWFKGFLYGPLEWLWRAGTYMTTKIPFRRKAPPAA